MRCLVGQADSASPAVAGQAPDGFDQHHSRDGGPTGCPRDGDARASPWTQTVHKDATIVGESE